MLLSLVLVVVAAVLLVVGWLQDGLAFVYLSIGACLLAMLLLGASVLVRRRGSGATPVGAAAPVTTPGRASTPVPAASTDADTVDASETADRGHPGRTGRAAVVRAQPRDEPTTQPAPATPLDTTPSATTAAAAAADDDPLDGVRGLGPSRRQALLEQFGSIDGIRAASEADLAAVPGLTPELAKAVKQHLD